MQHRNDGDMKVWLSFREGRLLIRAEMTATLWLSH
jgi:hypothetical protein